MSAGVSTAWQQVVEALAARSGQEDAAAARLAEVCLAAAPLTPECSRATRPGGLPSGRPPAEVTPRVAAALLDAVRGREGRVARYREVVGLLTIRGAWRPSSDDRYGEIRDQRERRDRALVLVLELGDATLTAMCRYYRGSSELRLTHWPQALTDLLEAADEAVALLEADEDGGRHPGPFAAVSNRPVPWAEPPRVLVRMIACRALKWSANAASLLGDMEQWAVSVRRAVELAEPLAEVRPSMLVEALAAQANLARHVGDRDTFRQVERRLRNWAETGGPERVLRGWLTVASDNAAHLHDYSRAYEMRKPHMPLTSDDYLYVSS
ncbi:hypothetical protein [Streptomyces sp. AC602_WCS936]|uniref:hypothetical protein n=1 Tax=Streptomyces sp. AC602_WCS936 TaxID=2823685 RepID=UPI001C270EB8|nr:hypothetical protein [Streptomyces sp. AC602_WCS936]